MDNFHDWLYEQDGQRYETLLEEFLEDGGIPDSEDGGFLDWAKAKYAAELNRADKSKP